MIRIQGNETIAYHHEEVFDAGIRAETWPEVDGLVLKPAEDILAINGLMKVGLQIQGLAIGLEGRVRQFLPGRGLVIEGESRMAAAQLSFELVETGANETEVQYTLKLRPNNLAVRALESTVKRYVTQAVPQFASGYRQNVINFLDSRI